MKKTYFEPSMKIGHVALTNIIATSDPAMCNEVVETQSLGRSSNPIWD